MALNPKASSVIEFISIPFAEFTGTLLYTFLSNLLGVANETSLLSVSIFEGLLVYMLSLIIGPRSGAHLNPALTISSFLMGQCRLILGISMIFMQCFGAFFGALLTRAVLTSSSFLDVLHFARILKTEHKGPLTDESVYMASSSAGDFFLECLLSIVYITAYIVPMKATADGFAVASSVSAAKAITSFIGYRTLGQSTNIARTLANNVMISIFTLDDSNWALFYLYLLAGILASFTAVVIARLLTLTDNTRNYNRNN